MLTALSSCLFVAAQNPTLADVLRQLRDPSVTAIDASDSRLDAADVAALATALACHIALTELNLQYNQIGDAGRAVLKAAARGRPSLNLGVY